MAILLREAPKEVVVVGKCQYCPFMGETKYHTALIHNACPDCPKGFLNLSALKSHLDTEHKNTKYPIENCRFCAWFGPKTEKDSHEQRHKNEYHTTNTFTTIETKKNTVTLPQKPILEPKIGLDLLLFFKADFPEKLLSQISHL